MTWLRLVDGEPAPGDARLDPVAMLRNLATAVEDGTIPASRAVVVLEDRDGALEVAGSGWHGDDIAPAVAMLEAAKLSLILGSDD